MTLGAGLDTTAQLGVVALVAPGFDPAWAQTQLQRLREAEDEDAFVAAAQDLNAALAGPEGGAGTWDEPAMGGPGVGGDPADGDDAAVAAPQLYGALVLGDPRSWYDVMGYVDEPTPLSALISVTELRAMSPGVEHDSGWVIGSVPAGDFETVTRWLPRDATGGLWLLYYDVASTRWRLRCWAAGDAGSAPPGPGDPAPADSVGGPVSAGHLAERGDLDMVIAGGAAPGDPDVLRRALLEAVTPEGSETAVRQLTDEWNRTHAGDAAVAASLYIYDPSERLFYPGDDDAEALTPREVAAMGTQALFVAQGLTILLIYWSTPVSETAEPAGTPLLRYRYADGAPADWVTMSFEGGADPAVGLVKVLQEAFAGALRVLCIQAGIEPATTPPGGHDAEGDAAASGEA